MLCDLERSQAEPFDGREDVIGGFVPSEGFGIFVDDVDVVEDRLFQFGGSEPVNDFETPTVSIY